MKKMIGKIISLTLAVSLLTGCSMGNTASGTPEASGSAVGETVVSAAAVSGTAVSTGQVGGYSSNDDNWYIRDRYGDALLQYAIKGNSVKTIPMAVDSVEWVTNEWVYYISGEDGGLWRIPIEKTKKGDRLKIKKQERVLKKIVDNYFSIVYVTDSYFLMEIENDDAEVSICKYDRESGKLTELMDSKKLGEFPKTYTGDQDTPVLLDGDLLIEGEKELFSLDPESGVTRAIYSTGEDGISDYVESGNVLYFLLDNALYQYDSISKKVSCLITQEGFYKEAKKLGLWFMMNPEVQNIYLEKGTLYFLVQVEWLWKGKKGFYKKEELFSTTEGHFSQLYREDKLMDYLDKKGWYEKDPDTDSLRYENTSGITNINDGIIYARYFKKEDDECQEVEYDIKTKKIKEISNDGGK